LFTCRTDDWHFLKTALFTFLRGLPNVQGAGDESGLGKQICWEAANQFGQNKFAPVNFRSKKSDLGFLLMNHLASAQKRFPKDHPTSPPTSSPCEKPIADRSGHLPKEKTRIIPLRIAILPGQQRLHRMRTP
jgi:hypothetical protein